jgi:hypothetical protein
VIHDTALVVLALDILFQDCVLKLGHVALLQLVVDEAVAEISLETVSQLDKEG